MKFSSFVNRLLPLVVALVTLLPATAQRRRVLEQPDPDLMRKLTIAQLAITQLYVDSVDQKKLVENAINGMLSKLDPHSAYSNPEETRRMNEPLEGNFEGIGVQFNMLEDTLVVIQAIAKGPSQKAGITNGDRIVSVDGRPIAGVKLERDSIMKLLRGPKGTKVSLGIVRPSVNGVLTFVVTRDKIPMNTLDAAYMIAPGVGYIRLDRFGATSGKEVREAIARLQKQGMKDLLFDLESNGGGYLGAAVEVASQFLNPKDLVVYTEGRATPKQVFEAQSGGLFRKGRLIVLVDEFSASAAEIVTGAVQDHDRALVVGRRTFGKGLVQRPIDLPDGSMIRLTTSHYFTPSGRCIQKPYVPGQKEDYSQDLEKRFKHSSTPTPSISILPRCITRWWSIARSTAEAASCPTSLCPSTPRPTPNTTSPCAATTFSTTPCCAMSTKIAPHCSTATSVSTISKRTLKCPPNSLPASKPKRPKRR